MESNFKDNLTELHDKIKDNILPLKEEFDKCSEDIEKFVKKIEKMDDENKIYVDSLRDILMKKNVNFNDDLECYIFFSILHFYALSEINGILFALLEEIKKSSHYLMGDPEYNKDKNFYDFFLDLVIYDSSQINFNYLSSLLSNTIITFIDVSPTYFLCILCNAVLLFFLYSFHLLELTDKHDNEVIYALKMLFFYVLIYLFTGIIGLLPFYLIENKNNQMNIVVGNSCLFLGVIIKNVVHILLIKTIDNKCTIYWIKVLLFLLTSLIYFIFLCIKNPKKKYDEIYQYSKGKLTLITKFYSITLQFQGFKEYFKRFFSTPLIIYLLILNFTSRTQKIMSKSKFKNEFEENKKIYMIWSFIGSFLIYIIIIIIYKYCFRKENEDEEIKEKIKEVKKLSLEEEKEEEEEKKINEIQNDINEIEKQKKKMKNLNNTFFF